MMQRISAALVTAMLILPVPLASAAEPETIYTFDIPAQDLGAALRAFGRASREQVVFDENAVRSKVSAPLSGPLTTGKALDRLLEGTGLHARRSTAGVIVIEPVAAQSSMSADLEELVVQGVRFYQPEAGQAASKMDLPLLETPLSVSVVTSDQIEARAADSLEQAFRYSSGIYSLSGGANRQNTTGFMVRGFNITGAAPLYVNGSKFPINSLSGAMEPYIYESVELLKGPASVLYGQSPPGGIINMVSKRSTPQPLRSVKLQAGSWDHRQVNADFGGPLTDDGALGYRLTGMMRDGETMISGIANERITVSSVIDWKPTERTTWSLLGTYHDTDTAYDNGKPAIGTVLPNPNGRVSPRLFTGEPGFNRSTPKGYTISSLLEHRFNDTWQVRQNVLWYDYDLYMASTGGGSVLDAATRRLLTRSPNVRIDTDKGYSIDNQVLGKWALNRTEHTVLFGVDYTNQDWTRALYAATVAPLDVFAPVYGSPVTVATTPALSVQDATQLGTYLQYHLKLDQRWIMLVGGRWDEARGNNYSGTGVITARERVKASAFTKRVGLLYLSSNGIAPYLSYSESFMPVGGTSFSGAAFEPTEGIQYEAGVKIEPKGHNAALTFAVYQLTQQNNLTTDLANPTFSVQTGEVRSRGFEAEGRVSFGRSLDLLASYNYTDAEVTKSNGPDLGRIPGSVPRNTASLWVDYHYPIDTWGEFSLGAGVRHVGQSLNQVNTVTVPSYEDYDVSARFDTRSWKFALNVKNILNKEYVAACVGACYYGDLRNVTFSAQYSW